MIKQILEGYEWLTQIPGLLKNLRPHYTVIIQEDDWMTAQGILNAHGIEYWLAGPKDNIFLFNVKLSEAVRACLVLRKYRIEILNVDPPKGWRGEWYEETED